MDVLLIAPLTGRMEDGSVADLMEADLNEEVFRHRLDYRDRLLSQKVQHLTLPECEVEWAQQVTLGRRTFILATASVSDNTGTEFLAIEQECASLVAGIVAKACPNRSVAWVARFALEREGSTPPEGWTSGTTAAVDVGIHGRVECGWGNGVIQGWEGLSEVEQREVLRGVVDAQHLWLEHDRIRDEVARASIELIEAADAGNSRLYARTAMGAVDRLSRDLLRLEASVDELRYSLQGPRREVGVAHLSAWGFLDSFGALSQRVDALGNLAQRESRKASSASQRVIGNLLLGIGALTIVDTTVALNSEASSTWSRNAREFPAALYLMSLFPSDIIISIAVFVTLIIGAVVVSRNWGSE